MRRLAAGATAIEVVVVIVILVMIIVLLLPALGRMRRGAKGVQYVFPVRGIHQGMIIYAQGNNGWFPGLDHHGNGDPTIEERYEILLKGNYFTGEYAISPMEQRTAWTTGPVTSDHYSFAMLELNPGIRFTEDEGTKPGSPNARRKEWRDTINPEAVVISDRNTGTADEPRSIHSTNDWRGSVGWNDNHVLFETTHIMRTTKYAGVTNTNDHLFDAASPDDALMIFSGTDGP